MCRSKTVCPIMINKEHKNNSYKEKHSQPAVNTLRAGDADLRF